MYVPKTRVLIICWLDCMRVVSGLVNGAEATVYSLLSPASLCCRVGLYLRMSPSLLTHRLDSCCTAAGQMMHRCLTIASSLLWLIFDNVQCTVSIITTRTFLLVINRNYTLYSRVCGVAE